VPFIFEPHEFHEAGCQNVRPFQHGAIQSLRSVCSNPSDLIWASRRRKKETSPGVVTPDEASLYRWTWDELNEITPVQACSGALGGLQWPPILAVMEIWNIGASPSQPVAPDALTPA
jgi:hypothetical protein